MGILLKGTFTSSRGAQIVGYNTARNEGVKHATGALTRLSFVLYEVALAKIKAVSC